MAYPIPVGWATSLRPLDMGFITVMVPDGIPMRVDARQPVSSSANASHWFAARYVRTTEADVPHLGVGICVEAHRAM
jgi:hypothetical protein